MPVGGKGLVGRLRQSRRADAVEEAFVVLALALALALPLPHGAHDMVVFRALRAVAWPARQINVSS
ncbi:hypothetical protein [Streptomyces sp. SA15]|uniref:hypothetical protein n=1 Tax=Streptomyces sp. SA15 TaxID=934019 RepID=UPI00117E056E|nr:hypothetical protein [Streptomyces sp. SA15]